MKITNLSFENFRNLENGSFEASDNINVIWGNNAQGKTNLLEALWLFTGGHSFRGNKDAELIKIGAEEKFAKLSAKFVSGEREQTASITIKSGKKTSVINGIEKKAGAALVGKICAVIFSPEHLLLVKEGPGKRRNFVDAAVCQIKPAYAKNLSQYNRTLQQRNALVKELYSHPEMTEMLDIWDDRLVYFGAELIKERLSYIKKLIPLAEEIYKGISRDKEKIGISYISGGLGKEAMKNPEMCLNMNSGEIKNLLYEAVLGARENDIRYGYTTVGPHRDDLDFTLDKLSAKTYGSQGQQRSIVLTLKLAEANMLEKSIGEAPVILLDDVMSELDESRQDYLLNHLSGRQVFITCCSPETVRLLEDGKGKRIYVEQGIIS